MSFHTLKQQDSYFIQKDMAAFFFIQFLAFYM